MELLVAEFLRRHLSSVLRLAVCAAALVYIGITVDWPQLASVWRNSDKLLLLAALAAFGPAPVLIALRLKWLLAVHNVILTAWQAIKVSFAGNFIIWALPVGTSGGDAAKAFYIAKDTPHKHEAVTTVFFDRVIGVVGLLLMSGLMVLLNWNDPAFERWGRIIGLLTLGLFVGGAVYFSATLRGLFRLDAILARLPLGSHLQRMDRAVLAFRNHGRRLVAALLLTGVLQGTAIFSLFLAGWALGVVGERPWHALPVYLAYVPICFLTGALPIGVMEVTFVELFTNAAHLGPKEAALLLSLVGRLIQLVWSLPGAIVVLKGGRFTAEPELLAAEARP